jgi:putative glutamine amidotransferase
MDVLNGIVITGGMFDIDPARYGAVLKGPMKLKEERTTFESAILEAALEADMPTLGICNGMQLLAVTLGGALIQHIPSEVPGALDHMPQLAPSDPHHAIDILPDTVLRDLAQVETTTVNSIHHQACTSSGHYVVSARSSDGIVEAIEVPESLFCIGLQWHPEYGVSPVDTKLIEAFISAAGRYADNRG